MHIHHRSPPNQNKWLDELVLEEILLGPVLFRAQLLLDDRNGTGEKLNAPTPTKNKLAPYGRLFTTDVSVQSHMTDTKTRANIKNPARSNLDIVH